MKKFLLQLLFFNSVGLATAQTNSIPASQTVDGYAAKVNDRVITIGEAWETMTPLLAQLRQRTDLTPTVIQEQMESFFRLTLNELIEQALILENFKKEGGTFPDQYVQRDIDRTIDQRFDGDKARFEQMLTSQRKTRTEYENIVRDRLIVTMMTRENVTSRARVTPKQVQEAYETYKEDFLIPATVKYRAIILNKGTTPEEQEVKHTEALQILQKLKEGADFAEVATASSEGAHAADGGAFPWAPIASAEPVELHNALENLPVGQPGDIIETESLLFILKVEGRKQADYQPFDEVRDHIEQALLAREKERIHTQWIEQLKKENYIRIYAN